MIKRVLIYLHGNQSNSNLINCAATFAQRHDALLTGLFITPDIMNYATVYGDHPLNLAQNFFDVQKSYAERAQKEFDKLTGEFKCETQWHSASEVEAHFAHALYADVLFVGQPSQEGSVIFNDSDFVDSLIIDTGLPTVIVPPFWQKNALGEHILLGWKQTREAVGAVRHSLDLMQTANSVDIVSVVRRRDQEEELMEGVEISAYLAAHDVQCNFFTEPMASGDKNEAETLQRHADDHGCDLIIIGGYGHTRLREIILGGVTRKLIRTSNIPILVAH